MGDSLSEGLGDPLPGGSLRGWAALLAEHLRRISPQLQFTNLAVRGHRTRDALRRQLPTALGVRPDLVTVFIGGNDVLLNVRLDRVRFAHQLGRLIALLAEPGVTVVLSTLPDLTACSPLPPPPGAARCDAAWRRSTRSSATQPTATARASSTRGPSRARGSTRSGASTGSTRAPRVTGRSRRA